jgi:hypothetical protein
MRKVMTLKYILHGKVPVPTDDLMEWCKDMEEGTRVVKQTRLPGDVLVSTVFLGLDHGFLSEGPPVLFETMIFGGNHDQYQERYTTWDDAEKGHQEVLDKLAKGIGLE